MAIYRYQEYSPSLAQDAWVADNATVVGQVTLYAQSSVWFNAVVRADNDLIVIGAASNVQDGAVLHVDAGLPLTLGTQVTVGHQAVLHGCTVGDGSLIGIGAIILNHAVIGRACLVAAGSVVPEGKVYPDGSLIMGSPARVVRALDLKQQAQLLLAAKSYQEKAQHYAKTLHRLDA